MFEATIAGGLNYSMRNIYRQRAVICKNALAIARIWEMEPHNRKFIRRARIAALIGGGGGAQQG